MQHVIITEVIITGKNDVHETGQGQRPKVKVTEVKISLAQFSISGS